MGAGVVGNVPHVDHGRRHELEAVERAGWDALCAGTGGDFSADLMAGDAVMVLAHGHVIGRDAVVESPADAPAWDRYELADLTAVPAGPDAATLDYRATAHRGDAPSFTALMTSTYTRRHGRWRLTVSTQTPVPG